MPPAKLERFSPTTVKLSRFAKALGHPARISILQFLAKHGESPCMDIVGSLPLAQASCSQHIAELMGCGLIKSKNVGKFVYYRLNSSALDLFCSAMSKTLKH